MMTRYRYVLAFCVLVAIIGTATWTAVGFGRVASTTSSEQQRPSSSQATATDTVQALRQPLDAQVDRIPAQIADGPLLEDNLANLGSARLVKASGRKVWLASSDDGHAVCEITAGAVMCPSVEAISATGVSPAMVIRAGEPVHVSGITSDEIGLVTVIPSQGDPLTVDVNDNYFAVDVSEVPKELHWTGPNGPESFVFHQPGHPG